MTYLYYICYAVMSVMCVMCVILKKFIKHSELNAKFYLINIQKNISINNIPVWLEPLTARYSKIVLKSSEFPHLSFSKLK